MYDLLEGVRVLEVALLSPDALGMHLPAVQVYDAYNEAYDWMVEVESQSTAMA